MSNETIAQENNEHLTSLGIELTEICNFACVHCYLERIIKPKVNLEFIKRLAAVAADAGYPSVYLTGGEPTLHHEFKDIYKHLRTSGYMISVFSNGSHLPDDILEMFQEFPPINLEITMYGMSEESYAKTTGRKNQFDKVMKNLSKLLQAGFKPFMKYNLLTTTIGDFDAFMRFVHMHGLRHSVNSQILPMLNGDLTPTHYRVPVPEIKRIGSEYGIDFSLSGDGIDGCAAGQDLLIDSQGVIRGCPVLKTDFDESALQNPKDAFEKTIEHFKTFHRNRQEPFCPAWRKLEGPEKMLQYLSQFGDLPQISMSGSKA